MLLKNYNKVFMVSLYFSGRFKSWRSDLEKKLYSVCSKDGTIGESHEILTLYNNTKTGTSLNFMLKEFRIFSIYS